MQSTPLLIAGAVLGGFAGLALGLATDNLALGMSLGIAMGGGLGIAFAQAATPDEPS